MKYKEHIDYGFVDSDAGITGIMLNIEGYEGVLYHYHQAKVVEEGELARLVFGYTIVNSGEHDPDELQKDENFSTIMGDILTTILLAKNENEKIRTNYPEEPDLQ
jgi:hypothetical protein